MQSVDCAKMAGQYSVGEAAGAPAPGRFPGTPEQQADRLVRAMVLHEFGQKGGAGVQGLAASLRKVLSKSGAPGTDLPDDVLKKIEASLRKAAQALADRGYDAKSIDAAIDKFRTQLADALDASGSGAQAPGSNSAPDSGLAPACVPAPSTPSVPQDEASRVDRFVAREVRRQKGAIEIETADGDVVSIRFRTKDVVTDRLSQTTSVDGTTLAASESVISRGRLQVAVDGTLDEDELAAIGDLLDKVDALAAKFFSGDVEAAFAAAGDVDVDSSEIASYQLDLTYSRKLAMSASTRMALPVATQPLPSQPAPSQPAPSGAAPTQPAQQVQPGALTDPALAFQPTSAAQSVDASASDPAAASSAASATSSDSTSAQPSESAAPPPTARKTIGDYIGEVLSKLGSVDGAGRLTFSLRFKVHVLTTALQTLQPSAPAAKDDPTAKSTALLTGSLQQAVG